MPLIQIDGISVDVADVSTAQLLSAALRDRDARIDALTGDVADRDSQLLLFQEDADVPPQFLKKKKEGEEEEEEEENEDAEEDEDTASKHDAEMAAVKSERDALQGQLDAMQVVDQDDPLEEEDLEEVDSIDGLLGRLQSADADARALIHDEIRGMVGGSLQGDSREDSDERVKWFNDRKELVGLAKTLRLDSVDRLDNLDLKRAVVGKYTGKDHSASSAERLDGAIPLIAEKLKSRQDSLDTASRALMPRGHQQRTDAQKSYKNTQLNAWKEQRNSA